MMAEVWSRLHNPSRVLVEPVTLWMAGGIFAALVFSGILIALLRAMGKVTPEHAQELSARWKSWCWLVVIILVPILLGAAWTIAAVLVLSLLCYYEYARVTGVIEDATITTSTIAGMLIVTFAVLDHYDRLFFATAPLTVALLAVITIPQDRPRGYTRRVALGALGFLLFGFSLAYLGNIANVPDYRPILLLILITVELNDVFAYCVGKLIGGPKLLPNTSPGKTIAGSVGALILTTALVVALGLPIFAGTEMQPWGRLVVLGLIISVLGQLGDLMLSSIKRDVGIKDIGHLIPGHGGLLDRFDSLLLVPPAVYHYLSFYMGPLGGDQPTRIFSG